MSFARLIMRALPVALLLGLGTTGAAQAAFTSSSPNPFAVGNQLSGTDSCVNSGPYSGTCTSNNSTTFTSSSYTFIGADQHFVVNAVLTGDLSGGLGSYALTGIYEFTLVGRGVADSFGSFTLTEDYVNLEGTVFGLPVLLTHNPNVPSIGSASIATANCGQCEEKFLINFGLTVNALFGIGGSEPAPVSSDLTGNNGAVPEPATWAMMLIGFGLAGAALRRRQPARGACVRWHRVSLNFAPYHRRRLVTAGLS